MRCLMQLRKTVLRRPGVLAGVVAMLWASLSLAERFPPDPVDELRQALRSSTSDLISRDPELARRLEKSDPSKPEQERQILNDARDRLVEKRIAAVRTVPDMRRALLLNDWRLNRDDETASVDRKYRSVLASRFEKTARNLLQHGNDAIRLAVLNEIAELGPSIRTPDEKEGIGRSLGPDLAELIRTGDSAVVRGAAAITLGQILPDPALAARALEGLLKSSDATERRSAVIGIIGLVRTSAQLFTSSEPAGKVRTERSDVASAGKAAAPLAGRGLADRDPEVRRLAAQAFQQLAAALTSTIPQPPVGQETSPYFKALESARTTLKPLMDALKDQAPVLAQALVDKGNVQVRLLTARAIEDIAQSRNLLQRPAGGEPSPKPPAPEIGIEQETALDQQIRPAANQKPARPASSDPLLDCLQTLLPALANAVADPSAQMRLQAVEALETIGPDAAPDTPALVGALSDRNLFVRWAAARALGKIGHNPTLVVPGLAHLLHDQDFDVDIAAARALQRFGPSAEAAVPDLVKDLRATDAEKRKEVLKAIEAIGTGASQAIPAIAETLADSDSSVRQLAAETLGKFGPAAAKAEPALRRALDDSDADVRRAASDALLKIQSQ